MEKIIELKKRKKELGNLCSVIKLRKVPLIIAIIYTISPIDIIPDAIPFFGTMDDGGVWFMNLYRMMKEVNRNQKKIVSVIDDISRLLPDEKLPN